jgi:4-amino-4-deoxy-L-arabinose transferase-like glycosyltransferase
MSESGRWRAVVVPRLRTLVGGHAGAMLCLALLAAFHIANNWVYVSKRVTIRGWDRPAHLVRTLIYNDILQEINVRSLFEAMTWSWNRPPLRHFAAVPFYRVFGISTDVALMSNALFMVILFFSVYGIGKRMYSRSTGLLAAFLVSMYPVLFGISRLSYVDYALTAMVALAVYSLVRTEGFVHRRHCVFLGLSLGLGALTKWPVLAFVTAPIVYVALRSGAVSRLKKDLLAKPQVSSTWRRVLVSPATHALASLTLNAAWYVPNRDRLSNFPLGVWIFPISWLLLAATFYVLSRPSGRGANLLGALLVGGAVASVWSLPNIGFLTRFVEVAYGGPNIDQAGIPVTELRFYVRYLQPLYSSQLSPVYFAAFLLAISMLAYVVLRNASPREALRRVSDHGWVLILWFVVPFAIFTLSLTLNSRFDLGLLPAAALITAHGLMSLRARVWRVAIIAVCATCGVVQFFALSFDELAWLREAALIEAPGVGRVNLLGQGMYIELPSSGVTDPQYFVPPRVLEQVRMDMEADGRESAQLANVVNRTYSNNAIFNYLMYDAYSGVELREFARGGWENPPVYPRLFECDYLLVASGSQDRVWEEARDALAIMQESPSFFRESFEPIWEWPVPDGDVFYLYKKRYHLREGYDLEAYRRLGEEITALERPGDAIVLDPPAQVEVLGRFYTGKAPPYPLPRESPLDEEEVIAELQGIAARHTRILAAFWDRSEADPDYVVEDWLNREGYRTWDEWCGTLQLVVYASGVVADQPGEEGSLEVDLGEAIVLRGYRLWDKVVEPGSTLRLTLDWEARTEVKEDYKVFVHLLDGEGRLVAQRDSVPVGGSRPTATWQGGEEISDNYGVMIPLNAHAGRYQLVVGMYSEATGERLEVQGEDGRVTDNAVWLASTQVGVSGRSRTGIP